MCGIVGYLGRERAAPVLLGGLQKLEYRGYDSAGIALMHDGALTLIRRRGRVSELQFAEGFLGNAGIGHTRWATHGAPCERNAHPQRFGKVCLVHNGIIENAARLKEQCLARGETFSSETDSEVVAHLIDGEYAKDGDLLKAVRRAARRLTGSYALAVLAEGTEEIVCARMRSPLVVAVGQEGVFAASDMTAVAAAGRTAYVLEDGDFARMTCGKAELFDASLVPVARAPVPLAAERSSDGKGAYPHFMRKEIAEVPQAVRATLKGARIGGLLAQNKVLCQTKYLHIVACGTAYHSGLCMKAACERIARIPVQVFLASEYRYAEPIVPADTLTVAVSQSGETADTLAAAELAKEKGSFVLGVVNAPHSSLARLADAVLQTRAGTEIAVAATKSFNAQLAALYALAARLAKLRGKGTYPLGAFPALCKETLSACENVAAWVPRFAAARCVFFLGRGADRYAALEGSLKLKEVSYLPGEGYAAGELKHGTLALVDERTPVVAVICDEALADKTMNAVHEVYARGAPVFLVTPFRELCRAREVTASVVIPHCMPVFAPMLSVIPLQLLAYHTALAVGADPDKPRNLAKSVTVE